MSKIDADIMGKQYYYRSLILKGKLKLPLDAAKKFIGQDTAFHLYSKISGKKNSKKR